MAELAVFHEANMQSSGPKNVFLKYRVSRSSIVLTYQKYELSLELSSKVFSPSSLRDIIVGYVCYA